MGRKMAWFAADNSSKIALMFYEAESEWQEEEWLDEAEIAYAYPWEEDEPVIYAPPAVVYRPAPRPQADVVSIGAAMLVVLMLLGLWRESGGAAAPLSPPPVLAAGNATLPTPTPMPLPVIDPSAVVAPYDEYWVTQGPHGASYGHMAVDLAAGQGATIKSPINGIVMNHYTDVYGNTTLIIENDLYVVTMLHGEYAAAVGDVVRLGQPVGTESNIGYTMDMQGNLCWNRDCGYHTHLNIYDKTLARNVNPLDLIE